MKPLLAIILIVVFVSCSNSMGEFNTYKIEQDVAPFNDGYAVSTVVWHNRKIVWSHYTWQDWLATDNKALLSLDSMPSAKKRDYELAQSKIKLFKEINY